MLLFVITFIFLSLAILGIAIRMLLIKGSNVSKACAHIEFENGEKVGCVCKSPTGKHEDCIYFSQHHPNLVKNEDFN